MVTETIYYNSNRSGATVWATYCWVCIAQHRALSRRKKQSERPVTCDDGGDSISTLGSSMFRNGIGEDDAGGDVDSGYGSTNIPPEGSGEIGGGDSISNVSPPTFCNGGDIDDGNGSTTIIPPEGCSDSSKDNSSGDDVDGGRATTRSPRPARRRSAMAAAKTTTQAATLLPAPNSQQCPRVPAVSMTIRLGPGPMPGSRTPATRQTTRQQCPSIARKYV